MDNSSGIVNEAEVQWKLKQFQFHGFVKYITSFRASRSNWSVVVVCFFGGRKSGKPEEIPLEQGREPTTTSNLL